MVLESRGWVGGWDVWLCGRGEDQERLRLPEAEQVDQRPAAGRHGLALEGADEGFEFGRLIFIFFNGTVLGSGSGLECGGIDRYGELVGLRVLGYAAGMLTRMRFEIWSVTAEQHDNRGA